MIDRQQTGITSKQVRNLAAGFGLPKGGAMLKRKFKWSVIVLSGLFLLSSGLLMGGQQDAQNAPDDNAITTSIQAKLFQDPSLKTQDIRVSTQDGVVTLTGNVDSQDQQAAVDSIASMEPGVVKVIDSLSVNASGSTPPANVEYSQPGPSRRPQMHLRSLKTRLRSLETNLRSLETNLRSRRAKRAHSAAARRRTRQFLTPCSSPREPWFPYGSPRSFPAIKTAPATALPPHWSSPW